MCASSALLVYSDMARLWWLFSSIAIEFRLKTPTMHARFIFHLKPSVSKCIARVFGRHMEWDGIFIRSGIMDMSGVGRKQNATLGAGHMLANSSGSDGHLLFGWIFSILFCVFKLNKKYLICQSTHFPMINNDVHDRSTSSTKFLGTHLKFINLSTTHILKMKPIPITTHIYS